MKIIKKKNSPNFNKMKKLSKKKNKAFNNLEISILTYKNTEQFMTINFKFFKKKKCL
jgi:inorganic pyrophosphatase